MNKLIVVCAVALCVTGCASNKAFPPGSHVKLFIEHPTADNAILETSDNSQNILPGVTQMLQEEIARRASENNKLTVLTQCSEDAFKLTTRLSYLSVKRKLDIGAFGGKWAANYTMAVSATVSKCSSGQLVKSSSFKKEKDDDNALVKTVEDISQQVVDFATP